MWPYEDHDEEEYYRVIESIEEYAVSLGAKLVDSKEETFTTYASDKYIQERLKMNIYQYGDEYFWIEHYFARKHSIMSTTAKKTPHFCRVLDN